MDYLNRKAQSSCGKSMPSCMKLYITNAVFLQNRLISPCINRGLIKNFLYDVMQDNRPEKTPDYFDGDTYIQHNTGVDFHSAVCLCVT